MVTKRARSRQAVPARRYRWEDLDEEDLLQLKFRQLRLQLKDSPAWAEVRRLYAELERRGIRFRPHVWSHIPGCGNSSAATWGKWRGAAASG
jgi:hypothetical protein